MHNPDHTPYLGFTRPQRIDKATHTLAGILKGIAIDGCLTVAECKEFTCWCEDNRDLVGQHPFSELVPKIQAALADGVIDPDEQADILWLCRNLSIGSVFYDAITTELQVLHGMLHGILADGVITVQEATALSEWTEENCHLKGTYPFDELDSLLTSVLADGKLDSTEQKLLKTFFEDFASYSMSKQIEQARKNSFDKKQLKLPGICAVCPEIEFADHAFCFTGASVRAPRSEMAKQVVSRKGAFKNTVCRDLHYLVVGASGNPCWAFSCYGRKVEEAVDLRRSGHRLLIVHENDFWDAVQDSPLTS